ncbi:hypothetical protein SAMN04488008_105228 [Maribacter orientalis]|uniref:Uncharacterized protein n=1 Tax=Maribacter orientalis TaxID=228957 RepID=A0A1H7T6N7_9FLAO|nr:hypothetical protein SAMN04488008_105228 [Maribacter orientalis]
MVAILLSILNSKSSVFYLITTIKERKIKRIVFFMMNTIFDSSK